MNERFLNRQFEVGLASWVIQDGNYDDFKEGQEVAFALEFYSELWTKFRFTEKAIERVDRAKYHVNANVVFSTEAACVIDFGLRAYQEQRPALKLDQGDLVSGKIYLGIDPFFYFESLYAVSGMPPLIYEWRIDSILQQTAPFIETKSPTGQTILARDQTKLGWKKIRETEAWSDDGGDAEYVLACTLLHEIPKSEV